MIEELDMNGLGGLNKSPEGVVIGLVQLQLPVVVTKADLARQTERNVLTAGLSLPVYSEQRTSPAPVAMSQTCQRRT